MKHSVTRTQCMMVALLFNYCCLLPVVIHVKNEAEYNKIVRERKHCVVKLSAPWCPACRSAKPHFDKIAQDTALQHVAFVDVNVDEMRESAAQNANGQMPTFLENASGGIPTFLYIQNGSIKGKDVGFRGPEAFRASCRKHFSDSLNQSVDVEAEVSHVEEKMAQDLHKAGDEGKSLMHKAEAEEKSLMEKAHEMFSSAFHSVKNMCMDAVHWVKGLFGK